MSSVESGLEVKAELFGWFMYFCSLARAFAEGEGMEIAGDWLKMFESYCCDISVESPPNRSDERLNAALSTGRFFCCTSISDGGGDNG